MALANSREPRRITRTIPAAQLIGLLLAFVLTAGAGGVIAAGLVIPLASGVDTAVDTGVEVFEEVPAELVPGPLSEQSQIYASDGKTKLATFYAQNRIVVPLDKVSDHMKNAVISIEDERFFTHGGVDPEGISRAAVKNLGGSSGTEGASTLTQQYVKNVLIEEAVRANDTFGVMEAREGSLTRKLREAKLAIALEKEMSKDEILQGYLNIAQFGKSVYGVETASQHYFNKSSKDLSVVEAATIAGITKAPNMYDPVENPEDAVVRRNLVIGKMWQLGYITTEERDEAKESELSATLDVQPLDVGCDAAKGAAFFCDYVIKEVMASPEFGETKADRQDLLYRGGLAIVTTLDIKKQGAAEKAVLDQVPVGDASGLESALASVEPGTGKILAMAQNVPYAGGADRPENTTTVNYAADYAHGNSRGFQPGSNFKAFVLAEWLRSGHTLNDMVNANQVSRMPSSFNTPCVGRLGGAAWTPFNSDGAGSGSMSVLKATYNSVNTAYADMGSKLNLCDLRNTAYNIGYRPTSKGATNSEGLRYSEALEDPKVDDIEIFAPMILGTQPTSPLNQAAAFATFASGGTYCSPVAILKVRDADGKEMKVPTADCKEDALPENVANTVTFAMKEVFRKGTYAGNPLSGGRPAAGKTGTSNLSWHTWFTGFTKQISTSVWVGDAAGDVKHFHTTVNGVYRPGPLYGSSVAAPAWSSYMEAASAGMPIQQFGPEDQALVGKAPAAPKPPKAPENDGGGGGGDSDSGDSGDGGGDGGDGGGDGGGGNGNGGGNGRGNGNSGND